ncbi:MAG: Dihydrodipicolinate synthase/N-acetylneuraminate lyase, partial [Verrucomicrobia bacterium]|nr:Dihydrodipicolinate synthase/N-acetylneuraminate lyase [Verrucomicrobiota bacterium]
DLEKMIVTLKEIAANRFHIDGAFDKMLFRVADPAFPLRVLPPYSSATEQEFARFVAGLPAGWNPRSST